MKLTKKDEQYLLSMGHSKRDMPQIALAGDKRNTVYEHNNGLISREKAIKILGRETYLSGLGRSAFHYTAVRESEDGKVVFFDTSKLFERVLK